MNENDVVLRPNTKCKRKWLIVIGHILSIAYVFVRWLRKSMPQIFQKSLKKGRNRAGDLDLGGWLPFE